MSSLPPIGSPSLISGVAPPPSPLTGTSSQLTTHNSQLVDGSVSAAGGFTNMLTDAIGGLSGLQVNADKAVAGVATNQGLDLHQAMLAMDQASLGMHLAVQVRDKAVEAYQSLINMQL